jgi:hypothetical protein
MQPEKELVEDIDDGDWSLLFSEFVILFKDLNQSEFRAGLSPPGDGQHAKWNVDIGGASLRKFD